MTRQMGKPLDQSKTEVRGLVERAEFMLGIAEREPGAPENWRHKDGLTRRIEHVPLGVVLDVAAWNYPLLIAVNVVVPAVLAGNAVLLKHSARTPLCGAHFEQCVPIAAGLHDLVVSLDPRPRHDCPPDRATRASATSRSRARSRAGRHVHRAAAERFIDTGPRAGGERPGLHRSRTRTLR